MLNKVEIEEKKKYIIEKLKGYNTVEENAKLRSTLINLITLETENEELSNVRLYNFVDTLSHGKLSLKRKKTTGQIMSKYPYKYSFTIDNDYFMYLLNLLYILKNSYYEFKNNRYEFKKLSITDEEKVNIARSFYQQIGNPMISGYAEKIFSDPSHYGFTNTFSNKYKNAYGINLNDSVFNKAYLSIKRNDNILDIISLCHEAMHGIDFYIKPFDPRSMCHGYSEIYPLTINYLIVDYLDSIGFDNKQVEAARHHEKKNTAVQAYKTFEKISEKLLEITNQPVLSKENVTKLRIALDSSTLKEMLKIESTIIAYGIYKQILNNKEIGLNNLCKLMINKPLTGRSPSFSFVGLDRNTILELAKEYAIELYYKREDTSKMSII